MRGDILSKLFQIPKKKKLDPLVEKEIKKEMKSFIEDLPQTITPKVLNDILTFGKTKIYYLLKTGEIPAHKVSGKWIIPKTIFLKWYYTGEKVEITQKEIKEGKVYSHSQVKKELGL